jgi:anti-anti-sigma regulatory factor
MNLRIEPLGDVACLAPVGRLDFDAAPGFQKAVERVLGGPGELPAAVIIDGTALEYVSSAGLCALQPAVREMFELSGLRDLAVDAAAPVII